MVRADHEAVELGVVAGVDHHRQVPGSDGQLESVGQPRAPDAAGQRDHAGHAASPAQSARAARTSPIRASVSASYGAGSRTMTVPKPSST